jgi:predicted acetyltransferase
LINVEGFHNKAKSSSQNKVIEINLQPNNNTLNELSEVFIKKDQQFEGYLEVNFLH